MFGLVWLFVFQDLFRITKSQYFLKVSGCCQFSLYFSILKINANTHFPSNGLKVKVLFLSSPDQNISVWKSEN